jgi:hypothetical protein
MQANAKRLDPGKGRTEEYEFCWFERSEKTSHLFAFVVQLLARDQLISGENM